MQYAPAKTNINMKRIVFLSSVLLLLACSLHGKAETSMIDSSQVDLSKFRFSYEEMYEIANPNLLKHRIFYENLSQGPDALWFDAVKRGNLADIKKMVESGQNLEAKDTASLGQTALGWAAFIGYMDVVQYLVEQGADLRATDKADVYNTVKSAVLGNNAQVVEYLYSLLKDEVNWDAKESDGETLFMVAAVDGRLETVKFILQFNPNLNAVSEQFDRSPLSGACEKGFTDVANLLIEKGAINHKTGKSSCE